MSVSGRSLTVARYRRGARLGKPGSFGEVFECTEVDGKGKTLRSGLAMKRLLNEQCDDADARERFKAEVRYQRKLEHPNVVEVIASKLTAEQPWMVMPRADATLRERLDEGRAADRDWALDIFEGITAGVAHAHDRGVLHRDLKPENVLLFGETPRVADFGLGKHLESLAERTATNMLLGTWNYMAPEQYGRARHARKPADVYGLGKMLWELIVNEVPRPFAPELSMIGDDGLREFIARCCEENPADRFPDAGAAASAFALVRGDLPAPATPRSQVQQLVDEWWVTPEGQDLPVVRRLHAVLMRHKDDEELFYEAVPQIAPQVMAHYIRELSHEYAAMIRIYLTHVGGGMTYDYCDDLARVCLQGADLHPDRDLREELLARVLDVGANRNRYPVADQVREFLWDIDDARRAREVGKVIRRTPAARWYDHPFLYRKPLADPIRKAFEALPDAPDTTDDDMLAVGDEVEHAAFGLGEIISFEPGGIVNIEFEDGAVRKLMWEYAPIRKL